MNKYLQVTGIALILSSCGGEYTSIQNSQSFMSAAGEGSFYECFDLDYYKPVLVPKVAYQKGECFMDLAKGDSLLGQNIFNEAEVGADQHTLLQYAHSWYALAANQGYALAEYSLNKNQIALYAFEDQLYPKDEMPSEMFAYQREFDALDSDHSGSLTFREAQADQSLAQSFFASDIDDDGRVSFGEFIVHSSEATAAGSGDSYHSDLD